MKMIFLCCFAMLVYSINAQTYHPDEVEQLRQFLDAPAFNHSSNGLAINSAYVSEDPGTWDFITWSETTPKRVVKVNMSISRPIGSLNVEGFESMTDFAFNTSRESYTNIEVINFKNCTALRTVESSGTIYNLNFEGCAAITAVDCRGCFVKELDLNACINLQTLDCSFNNISELYLNNCEELIELDCTNNKLQSIDLTNKKLEVLKVGGNPIRVLNTSKLPNLKRVDAKLHAGISGASIYDSFTFDGFRKLDLSAEWVSGKAFNWFYKDNTPVNSGITDVEGVFTFSKDLEGKEIYCQIGDYEGSTGLRTVDLKIVFTKIPQQSLFYDSNGDGKLEYIYQEQYTNNNYWAKSVNEGPQQVLDIPFSNTIYDIINVNSDGTPDFAIANGVQSSVSAVSYKALSIPNKENDPNVDGRPDFGNPGSGSYYQNTANQSFLNTKITIYTMEEYLANQDLSAWGGSGDYSSSSNAKRSYTVTKGIPSMSDHMLVCLNCNSSQTVSYSLSSDIIEEDFNNDGLTDIMGDNGVLYNVGNNTYVESPFPGQLVAAKDLNNDGICDFVIYNEDDKKVTLMKYVEEQGYVESVLFENQAMDNLVKVADFDGDGDLDIFLPFSAVTKSTSRTYAGDPWRCRINYNNIGAFYALSINDGDGNFTIQESFFSKKWYGFENFIDVDGDGLVELIVTDYEISPALPKKIDTKILKWDGTSYIEQADVIFSQVLDGYSYSEYEPTSYSFELGYDDNTELRIADIDSDGKYEIWSANTRMGEDSQIDLGTANTAPDKMLIPTVNYQKGSNLLEVFWDEGNDGNYSSCDLTYALRIGSASGKGDMVYAHANANGSRRNLAPGNMGSKKLKRYDISTWPAGTYYVSVQAIDPQCKGGEWSEEVIFEKETFYADFDILPNYKDAIPADYKAIEAITYLDSVMVKFKGELTDGLSLEWDFDNAVIISGSDAGPYKLRYDSEGIKTITMKVMQGSNELFKVTSELSVSPIKLSATKSILLNGETPLEPVSSYDFDNDGDLDFVSPNLLVNNGDGTASQLAKIFNLSYKGNLLWYDYDLDGNLDAWDASSENTGQNWDPDYLYTLNILQNNGSNNFTYKKDQPGSHVIGNKNYKYDKHFRYDINGDGLIDAYGTNGSLQVGWLISSSDYTGYELKGINYTPHGPLKYIDWNRDGHMDMWTSFKDGTNCGLKLFINKDGIPSEETTVKMPVPINESNNILAIEDMDNDEDWDVIMRRNDRSVIIWYNNGTDNFNDSTAVVFPEGCDSNTFDIADFDNNGYLDFVVPCGENTVFIAQDKERNQFVYHDASSTSKLAFWYQDMNNDGKPDFSSYPKASYMETITLKENTAPLAPTGIMAVQTDTTLKISWQHGIDKQTPAAQMRYNLSVKKAGESGAGSFIISPGNGLNANAALQPDRTYIRDNKYILPITRFEAGEYELQIQSIDLWNATSSFSDVVTINVSAEPMFECPEEVCFAGLAEISYKGTPTSSITWDFDDGQIVSGSELGPYEIQWNTDGVKTITATVDGKSFSKQVKVLPQFDASFAIGDYLISGTSEPFTVLNNNGTGINYVWNTSSASNDQLVQNGMVGTISINEEGSQDISLYIEKNGCQSSTFTQTVTVLPALPEPRPNLVAINANGKNSINWDASEWPAYVTNVHIYKEGKVTNAFEEVAAFDKSAGIYVDEVSTPDLNSERYYLVLEDEYGHVSNNGPVQETVHLTINKGLNTSWNLIWNAYKGADIASYKIYRGATADNMQMIAELAGSKLSFTDISPLSGEDLYQIEIVEAAAQPIAQLKSIANGASALSNIVNTSEALTAIMAETMSIKHVEEVAKLSNEQTQLHMYASILPTTATYKEVLWEIVSGEELATITSTGLLEFKNNGSGTVKVKATTLDGSDMSAELDVAVELVTYDLVVKTLNSTMGTTKGTGTYNSGEVVEIEAIASDNYKFKAWTDVNGATLSTDNPLLVRVNADFTIVADFERVYTVTTGGNYDGKGGVVKGAGKYNYGTYVIIEAIPNEGYEFAVWHGDTGTGEYYLSNDNPYTLRVRQDIRVEAQFKMKDILTTSSYPVGAGTTTGDGEYSNGDAVTITATPNTGYVFSHWQDDSGEMVSKEASYTFNIYGLQNYTAVFVMAGQVAPIVNPEGAGSVTGGGDYSVGDVIQLKAVANEGYIFGAWYDEDGNILSNDATFNYTVKEVNYIKADFIRIYSIAVVANIAEAGTVSEGGNYQSGAIIQLTATANDGYAFKNWTNEAGNVLSTEAVFDYTVTSNQTLTANFEAYSGTKYTLSMGVNIEGAGTVTGGGDYIPNSSATIEAIPADGYKFGAWHYDNGNGQESLLSFDNPHTFNVTGNIRVEAQFSEIDQVIANVLPQGAGVVNGSGEYQYGQMATLIATANDGYQFSHWTDYQGNIFSHNASIEVNVYGTRRFTAHFVSIVTITTMAQPAEAGTTSGGGNFATGEIIRLTATANDGYVFSNWTNEAGNVISTEAIFNYTITNDQTLTANFESHSGTMYTLTMDMNIQGAGTVSGGGSYIPNAQATIEAVPADNYRFVTWHADNGNGQEYVLSEENPYTFEVYNNLRIEAQFEEIDQVITSVLPVGAGVVNGSGAYQYGQMATLTAKANDGYRFSHWTDEVGNVLNELSSFEVTVNGTMHYTAHFVSLVTITTQAQPAEAGATSGGGNFAAGDVIPLTATANNGYEFVNWTDASGSVISTETTFNYTVSQAADLRANFNKVVYQYTVTTGVNIDGAGTVTTGGTYEENTAVTIAATPADAYLFKAWYKINEDGSESLLSSANPYTHFVTEDVNIEAQFEAKPKLELTNASISFGDLELNQTKTISVELVNNFQTPIQITAYNCPDIISAKQGNVTEVGANSSATIEFELYGNTEGAINTSVSILTDCYIGQYAISINGNVVNSFASGNINIESVSPSCYQLSDGSIKIITNAKAVKATLEETSEQKNIQANSSSSFEGLEAGTYHVTILAGTSERNYTVILPEQEQVMATAVVKGSTLMVNVQGGQSPYNIKVGDSNYTSNDGQFKIAGLKSGKYTVVVSDQNQCAAPSNIDIEVVEMIIAPNPAVTGESFLYLPAGLDISELNVQVFSISGEMVISRRYNAPTSRVRIDVSQLTNGIYIVKTICKYSGQTEVKSIKLEVRN